MAETAMAQPGAGSHDREIVGARSQINIDVFLESPSSHGWNQNIEYAQLS